MTLVVFVEKMPLHRFRDIHTHVPSHADSLLSIPVSEVVPWLMRQPEAGVVGSPSFSLQLHPWHLKGRSDITAFETMAFQLAANPAFVAVGECGLDSLCGVELSLQHEAFLAALRIAKQLQRPVIIHCVRLWQEMMSDVQEVLTTQECIKMPVVIHGFRKGPQLARQLLDAGFSISLGTRYNEEVKPMIPPDRLYFETDQTE